MISILVLLEEADEWDVIIRKHFMRLHTFLLMLSSASRKNLLDFFSLRGQLHHCPKELFLEVTKELHLIMHVIVHGHECQFLSGAQPADQLVANVQEPGNCLEVISLSFAEVFKCLDVFVWQRAEAMFFHSVKPTS